MEEWLDGRLRWYEDHGCDERGVPTTETLKKLGLEFTIRELEKAGAWDT
jgi:hypothetical protein